jgi:hypothetical protein
MLVLRAAVPRRASDAEESHPEIFQMSQSVEELHARRPRVLGLQVRFGSVGIEGPADPSACARHCPLFRVPLEKRDSLPHALFPLALVQAL